MMVLASVETAVQPGFSGPVVDTGSALALCRARGVEAEIAAALIGAATDGIMCGAADLREAGNGS